tara:strand:- start:5360 stop:6226 length:867 start_codon:yes stop_codon:yes gene_type:complete
MSSVENTISIRANVKRAWALFGKHYAPCLPWAVMFTLAGLLIFKFMLPANMAFMAGDFVTSISYWVVVAFAALVQWFCMAGVYYTIHKPGTSFVDTMTYVISIYLKVIVACLLYAATLLVCGLLIGLVKQHLMVGNSHAVLATVLVFAIGLLALFFLMCLTPLFPLVILEKRNPFKAYIESYQLVFSQFWRTCGYFIYIFAITLPLVLVGMALTYWWSVHYGNLGSSIHVLSSHKEAAKTQHFMWMLQLLLLMSSYRWAQRVLQFIILPWFAAAKINWLNQLKGDVSC